MEEYNRRLLHELLNRESESSVRRKTRTCSMKFVDSENERQWRNTQDVTSCVSLVSLPLTLASCFLSYLLIGPSWSVLFFTPSLSPFARSHSFVRRNSIEESAA